MLSLSSVKRALANLESLGVIEVERPPGLRTKNRYTLMAVGSERADVRPERPNDGSERADVGSQLKQGSLEPLTEEKRRTKKKIEGTRSKASNEPAITHEAIYQAYPRKVGKKAALKTIATVCKTIDPDDLLERVEAFSEAVAAWPEKDKQYVPHPATWFNQGRYDDDQEEWRRLGDGSPANVSEFNLYQGRAL